MSDEEVEATLLRIEAELKEISRTVKNESAPLVALTVELAAKALSRGKSTIWEMIRDGELRTIFIRKTRMVPMSEVLRVGSLPHAPRAGPRVIRGSVAAEQELVRAALRRG